MQIAKTILVCLIIGAASTVSFAQVSEEKKLSYEYPQKCTPFGLDNYLFSTYYYNGKNTYNMRGSQMSSTSPVSKFRVNPAGATFVVLDRKGVKGNILVYDLWKANKLIKKIEWLDYHPVAVCFSPDSRLMAVAGSNRTIQIFDTHDYQAKQKIVTNGEVSRLDISGNNFFLCYADDNKLCVWNLVNGEVRTEIMLDGKITDVRFSTDSRLMGILTDNGVLTTYDTQLFQIKQKYDAVGEARSFYFHQDGKYAAVVTGDKRIAILNLMNLHDREYVDNNSGGITDVRFLKNNKKESYIAYNTNQAIVYTFMNRLAENYTRLLADELNERMTEWLKQRPDETLEDYNKRVNEETRAEQMKLFEREIVTRLADNLVERSELTLGSYNEAENLLSLNFETMPSIYLQVPGNELGDFADPGMLEFRNAVYGLTSEDKFELIYADVYNKKNGKTYVFDNLARQSLAYLQNDENFVPLDIIQKTNLEDLKLQEIKNGIISLAKNRNTISDNTKIDVASSVVTETDASGNKVLNYHIRFTYTVDQKFSAREDFGSGKYKTEESGAAMAMLSIMKESFGAELAKYIVEGKKLRVTVTGMADASPISGSIPYDACYGEFENEPIKTNGDLTNVSVNTKGGITTNEQLAFLRAVGVKQYIVNNVTELQKMKSEYNYQVEVAKMSGSQFRRISVEYIFVDAF